MHKLHCLILSWAILIDYCGVLRTPKGMELSTLLSNIAASNANSPVMVLEQMLSGLSFSVLLYPLVTTIFPNKFIVLAAATEYVEEGTKE